MAQISNQVLQHIHKSYYRQTTSGLLDIPIIELPLWFFLTVIAFWPSRYSFFLVCGSIPLSHSDLLFMLCASAYTFIACTKPARTQTNLTLHKAFFIFFALYVLASTLWGNSDSVVRNYAAVRWVMVIGSLAMPYVILSRLSSTQVEGLLSRMTVFLTFISFSYLLLVLDIFEVRASWCLRLERIRLQGPLINSAVGIFVLLPALSWAIHMSLSFSNSKIKILGRCCVIILIICIFMLGSRMALVCTACFVMLFIWHYPKTLFLLFGGSIIIAILLSIFTFGEETKIAANADRMTNFQTTYRAQSYRTCLNILKSQNLGEMLQGAGLGHYWSWCKRSNAIRNRTIVGAGTYPSDLIRDTLVATEHGPILWACHSTVLWTLIEFGLIGGVALVYTFGKVTLNAFPKAKPKYPPYLFLGLAASTLNHFSASPCYIYPPLCAIWCLFFFGGERLCLSGKRA